MAFKWSRCRRCGRTLTDPKAAKRGIGPECIKKAPMAPTGTVKLMDAIDTLLAKGHCLPPMQQFTKPELDLYATAIDKGAKLRAPTKRLLLRQARLLQENDA